MSVTENTTVQCPRCGGEVMLVLVRSLNAGRHPELKRALLARELNRARCPGCDFDVVVEAELTYFDAERRQLVGTYPARELVQARACAEEVMAGYDRWICIDAPRAQRQVADRFLVRVCFGYDELRDKILIDDAGLSDLCVEALKSTLLVTLHQELELRPITLWIDRIDADALWLVPDFGDGADPSEPLRVPRALYDAVAARRPQLLELCPGLASGPHVSVLRLAQWHTLAADGAVTPDGDVAN